MNLVPLLLQLSEAVEWQDMWRKQLGVPRPVPTFRTLSHFVDSCVSNCSVEMIDMF